MGTEHKYILTVTGNPLKKRGIHRDNIYYTTNHTDTAAPSSYVRDLLWNVGGISKWKPWVIIEFRSGHMGRTLLMELAPFQGQAPMSWLSPRLPLRLSAIGRHGEKAEVYKPASGPSAENRMASTWILAIPAWRNCEKWIPMIPVLQSIAFHHASPSQYTYIMHRKSDEDQDVYRVSKYLSTKYLLNAREREKLCFTIQNHLHQVLNITSAVTGQIEITASLLQNFCLFFSEFEILSK